MFWDQKITNTNLLTCCCLSSKIALKVTQIVKTDEGRYLVEVYQKLLLRGLKFDRNFFEQIDTSSQLLPGIQINYFVNLILNYFSKTI